MKPMTKIVLQAVCIIVLLTATATLHAQILPPPGPGSGGGGGGGGTGVPLDPMSWTLLASAGAYAMNLYRKKPAVQE
ncbi:MAG: hypothetical protein SFW35_11190 [Chitinophagales bacterium]|nr:hypothetical protein [Chitinophagales bacterium]